VSKRSFTPLAGTWLVLVGATAVSFLSWLDTGLGNQRLAGSAVLVIAFFKARLIALKFMELADAVLPLRLLFEAWVIVAAAVLLVLFWQA